MEYMALGEFRKPAYTPIRLAVNPKDGKFFKVPANEVADADAALDEFNGGTYTADAILGRVVEKSDIYLLEGDKDGEFYWYVRTPGTDDLGYNNLPNGVLGTFMPYVAYAKKSGDACELAPGLTDLLDGDKTQDTDTPTCSVGTESGAKTSIIDGAKRIEADEDGTHIVDAANDVPDAKSNSDDIAKGTNKYVPVVYGAEPINADPKAGDTPIQSGAGASQAFRHFVDINYGDRVITLSQWKSGEFNADLCVAGQSCGSEADRKQKPVNAWIVNPLDTEGWAYWGSPFTHTSCKDAGHTECTPELTQFQKSVSLRKQMVDDFDYDQYISLQVATEDELHTGKKAADWNVPAELRESLPDLMLTGVVTPLVLCKR
jgi:hypothetical protein